MLMINGEIKKLPNLKKKTQFSLTSEYIGHDPKSGKKFPARRAGFPNQYTINDTDGTPLHVIYFTQRRQRKVGDKIEVDYLVNGFDEIEFVNGALICQTHQPDLNYFLMNHPLLAGGDHQQEGIMPRFKLERAEDHDKTRVATQQEIFEAQRYLSDSKQQLMPGQLRDLLRAYPEANVDELEDIQVKSRLLDYIMGVRGVPQQYAGPKVFHDMVLRSSDPDMRARIAINKAMGKIIYFSDSTRHVRWKKNDQSICTVPRGMEVVDFLTDYLMRRDGTGVLDEILDQVGQPENVKEEKSQIATQVEKMQEGKKLTQDIKDHYQRGCDLIQEGQYEQAIEEFKQSLEINDEKNATRKSMKKQCKKGIKECEALMEEMEKAEAEQAQ